MPETLEIREAQVLSFMRQFLRDRQRLPFGREIAQKFGWKAEGTSRNILKTLEKKGHITRDIDKRIQLINPH